MSSNVQGKTLFVSGVDISRPHPSAKLASSYTELGVQVTELFLDARNLRSLLSDFYKLQEILSNNNFSRVIANVNGPIAQCLIIVATRKYNIHCNFWIMDCYPGCLKYVTKLWWLFWIPFFLLTFLVKRYCSAIFYIDEAFPQYSPRVDRKNFEILKLARPKLHFTDGGAHGANDVPPEKVIGIVGNIEQNWIDGEFNTIYPEIIEAGYSIVVATSSNGNLDNFVKENIRLISPWLKEDTEKVFNSFSYILVPLSDSRIYYSSPSKIIDAYARGIQPVIYGNKSAWNKNKDRMIYSKCIHYDDFIKNAISFTPRTLKIHAKIWPSDFIEIASQTISHEL